MSVRKKSLQIIAGILVGLCMMEFIFYMRDDGAFPHVNIFQADPTLGLRLRPNESQKVSVAGNPISTIHTNSLGWRGAEWKTKGGILVVGDSQIFGLGVNDDETTPAQLAALTKMETYNAGVPTYGPEEFKKVIDEIGEAYKPQTIVLILNFSNDLFEIGKPNTERHRVWDGWAVRIETAPKKITSFPGRSWLYSKSHAFFALRKIIHHDEKFQSLALPSEGTLQGSLQRLAKNHNKTPSTEKNEAKRNQELKTLQGKHERLMRNVQSHLWDAIVTTEYQEDALEALDSEAQPGDIIDGYAEAARPIRVTAQMLKEGVRIRRKLSNVDKWIKNNPNHPATKNILKYYSEDTKINQQINDLAHQVSSEHFRISPFLPLITDAKNLATKHGAELVVVALPLDVQVDKNEWKKYGQPVTDLDETLVLLDDLVKMCQRMGIRALNAAPVLRKAQPGAFLHGDLHLTPKGHKALASGISKMLMQDPPIRYPKSGLPEGRSRVPQRWEWQNRKENIVRGSSRNNCETKQIREWQRISCTTKDRRKETPLGVVVVEAPLETMTFYKKGYSDLITPLIPGRKVVADFHWSNRVERLTITWDGVKASGSFTPADNPQPLPKIDPNSDLLDHCQSMQRTYKRSNFGATERGCRQTYYDQVNKPNDCVDLLQCATGTRIKLPECPNGQVRAGAAGHCMTLCSKTKPCHEGVCRLWMDTAICQ